MRVAIALAVVCAASAVSAHAFNPGLLQLDAHPDGTVDVGWKITAWGEGATPLVASLPARCRELTPHRRDAVGVIAVEHWRIDCGAAGLAGGVIAIGGFTAADQDVLVRITTASDHRIDVVLRMGAASFEVPAQASGAAVLATYVRLGIDHILSGYDHLLFVLGLILLVPSLRRLCITISAFTLAHSITLSLAALHVVQFPSRAVEAVIALSVVFLAAEIVRERREPTLITRLPWVAAIVFGLLHGFGFAGALAELGLPDGDIPLALFGFNCGVELGQLMFVAVVGAGLFLVSRARVPIPRRGIAYGIGTLAAYWTCERVVALWS